MHILQLPLHLIWFLLNLPYSFIRLFRNNDVVFSEEDPENISSTDHTDSEVVFQEGVFWRMIDNMNEYLEQLEQDYREALQTQSILVEQLNRYQELVPIILPRPRVNRGEINFNKLKKILISVRRFENSEQRM